MGTKILEQLARIVLPGELQLLERFEIVRIGTDEQGIDFVVVVRRFDGGKHCAPRAKIDYTLMDFFRCH